MSLNIRPTKRATNIFSGKMAEAVKVIVRCRPINEREQKLHCKVIVDMVEDMGKCMIRKPGSEQVPKEFTFDGAYYVNSTTEQIYNDIAYPLVEGVVEGYNGTVFAYGQTGCGKSFSMQGIDDPPSQRGIIPRAFQHIFESIEVSENTKYLVHASYLEIYNEDVRDLLSKNIKDKLELKEHPDKGVYVKDLSMQRVGNVAECERVMATGWQNRTVGATLMNADSSRSHSIFTIYLEACDTGIDGGDHIRAGKLNLVDLAGSERQSKTGATGERLKEATKINLSLSALGNVISALVDGRSKHIPYRDSKLTRLLQDSLGGNTKTLMVACLSPADNNYDETLSTLRYANRAKNIKNKPHINEDPKDALLREYQEEIKKLRGLLAGQLGPDGIKAHVGTGNAALLEGQSPVQKSRSEGRQDESEADRARDEQAEQIKLEYEGKLSELKQRYEAEQMSKAKLQEDMNKLKTQYDQHVAQTGLTGQAYGRTAQEMVSTSTSSTDVGFYESSFENGRLSSDSTSQQQGQQVAQYIGSSSSKEKGAFHVALDDDAKLSEDDVMQQHEEALKRLQMLQENMIGGERSRDEEAKRRRQSRRKHVDERKQRLARAAKHDDDETILDVYDSVTDEVKARDKMIARQKKQVEGLKMEVEDLNYEFERDRSEYLATIRRQQRDLQLLNDILSKVQPTIRRDCNYSNLDRVKSETRFDEERQEWVLPDLTIIKTSLPSASPQNGTRSLVADRGNLRGQSPPMSASSSESYSQRSDEDKYLEKLNRSNNEQIASNYFMSKRRVQQIVSSSHSEANSKSRLYGVGSGTVSPTSNGFPQNGERGSVARSYHHPSLGPPGMTSVGNSAPYAGIEDLVRRPHKLEKLETLSPLPSKSKKKKKKPQDMYDHY